MKYLFLLIFVVPPLPGSGPELGAADKFVDSVGVDTHLTYTDSLYYQNFPLINKALMALKVRHIRDGLHDFGPGPNVVYDMHNKLVTEGIHCNYVVDERIPSSVILNYPNVVNDMESLENANEVDAVGGTSWVEPLQNSSWDLKTAADALHIPVIGPSLINQHWWGRENSFMRMGDISYKMTYNNLHNYFGAFWPETRGWGGGCTPDDWCYGSMLWNMNQADIDGPGVPIWTTETGYTIDPSRPGSSVPESVFATYLPRLLLAQWNAGIRRTYIYELADDPSTRCCMGLMDSSGHRREPFIAMSNLLRLLSDKGKPFKLTPLDYIISGAPDTLHHTLLEKHNKTYWLALWLGVSIYDPYTFQRIHVDPETITIAWQGKSLGYRVYKFRSDGSLVNFGHRDGNSATVEVDDKVLILKIAMT